MSTATPSPEVLEAQLAAQREALVADLEDLGARLAPAALKSQARQCVNEAAGQARDGFRTAFASARARAARARQSLTARTAPGAHGAAGGGPSPAARLNRLLDDARDGDPGSLALVTGVAVVLAGISVVAVVKAVRS